MKMQRRRTSALGAALVRLSLVAAACGGDDEGTTGEAAQTAETVDKGVQQGVRAR
ncbi:MAG: hypothetical protein R2755_32960 [Acidimicrobiales bacterium]